MAFLFSVKKFGEPKILWICELGVYSGVAGSLCLQIESKILGKGLCFEEMVDKSLLESV